MLDGNREHYLTRSVADCPGNPLAVYSLARVMNLQGRREEARAQIDTACAQYTRYGWLPPGPAALQASLQSSVPEVASTAHTGNSTVAAPMQTARPIR